MPDRSDYELPAHPPAPGPVPDWPLTGVEEAGVIAQMRRDAPARGVHVIPGSVPEGVVPPSTSLTPPPEPLRLPEQAMPIARTVAGQSAPSGNLRDQIAEALYQWTLIEAGASRISPPVHPRTLENLRANSIARADAVMPIVQAALTDAKRQAREQVAAEYQDLLASIWLYVKWRYVTKQLTTEQKELWADAVEAASDPGDPPTADRWWRE